MEAAAEWTFQRHCCRNCCNIGVGHFSDMDRSAPTIRCLSAYFFCDDIHILMQKGYISQFLAHSKSFIYLGDISYSIYIVHFLVAFSLYNSVKVILPKIGFHITTASPDLVIINGSMLIMDILTVMYLVVIVVLASLTYRFIEKPGIHIFGKWAKKYS